MVMRMKMEETILSQFRRLPGLTSEFSGLDTIMNRDEDIGFEDYLNGKFSNNLKSNLTSD